MTDSYHYQILNRGEMEVLADGGVRWCGQYSGDMYHLSAEKVRERGVMSAQQFAEESRDLNGYKIVRATIGPFPSGATLKTSGDKIVGRVEASPATYDVSVGKSLLTAEELNSAIRAVLDSFRAQDTIPEPIRPALDWNTATPFDTFGADFIVTKGAEPTSPLYDSPTTDSAYPAIAGLLRG